MRYEGFGEVYHPLPTPVNHTPCGLTRSPPNNNSKQLRDEERRAKNGGFGDGGDEDGGEEEDAALDPEIAAAMGFGGFK